nr:MAG TPA: hypothetical protein [Caudoviricetes sp.]
MFFLTSFINLSSKISIISFFILIFLSLIHYNYCTRFNLLCQLFLINFVNKIAFSLLIFFIYTFCLFYVII